MYAEFSQKLNPNKTTDIIFFFLAVSEFGMLFSFPNSFALTTITVCACVWICVQIDHGHQCLHMQKQSNHNFKLIDKASPEASTLSLSLYLFVYQLKSVHFMA